MAFIRSEGAAAAPRLFAAAQPAQPLWAILVAPTVAKLVGTQRPGETGDYPSRDGKESRAEPRCIGRKVKGMAQLTGVVGGTGFYELVEGKAREVATPFGATAVTIGGLGGREVAFLARHGAGHRVPPHRINARANVWALASLGVRAVVSTAAVGSLRAEYAPTTFAIADQLLDRTWGRADTFYDENVVRHLPFAEPFCPDLRSVALAAVPVRPNRFCRPLALITVVMSAMLRSFHKFVNLPNVSLTGADSPVE
ncbi:MTAP family purine nucleoside phosphorylase [Agromyces soli]